MNRTIQPRKFSILIGITFTVCGILTLIASNTFLRDWIVIGYGIRAIDRIQTVSYIIIGAGLVMIIINVTPLLMVMRKQKVQRQQSMRSERDRSQMMADYAKDSTNPDLTRKRLVQLKVESPALSDLVTKCLVQMDLMDILQAKQNSLIEANDALYLKDSVAVLDNVEKRLCKNFRNIINLCIAADSVESLENAKIDKYLDDNQKKLDGAKELLNASTDWINRYDEGTDDMSEIESWIEVIRKSLGED